MISFFSIGERQKKGHKLNYTLPDVTKVNAKWAKMDPVFLC